MELSSIQRFLEVYKEKLFSEDEKRKILVDVIKKKTGITLKQDALTLKKNILYVTASPIVRNEIFMHKAALVEEFKTVGRSDILDIV